MLNCGSEIVVDIKKLRDLKINDEQIKNFNEIVKLVKFDFYENVVLKGFIVFVYENGDSNNFKFKVYDVLEMLKGLLLIDIIGRNIYRLNGLVRILLNDIYRIIVE